MKYFKIKIIVLLVLFAIIAGWSITVLIMAADAYARRTMREVVEKYANEKKDEIKEEMREDMKKQIINILEDWYCPLVSDLVDGPVRR